MPNCVHVFIGSVLCVVGISGLLQLCVSWCPSSYVVTSTLLASMNAV